MTRVRWIVAIFGLWFLWSGRPCYADETTPTPAVASDTPAVVNHPVTGYELTKSIASYLQPGADWFVGFKNGSFNGYSGALYTASSKGFPLASIRLGFGQTDPVSYGTLALDLPGLAGRFIPASIKGVSPSALNGALDFAAKYLRVGPSVGLDWDTHKVRYGLTVGAAYTKSF